MLIVVRESRTIRMNEIFLCLAFCGQKLNFYVKRSGEDEIGTIILKSDIYDAF